MQINLIEYEKHPQIIYINTIPLVLSIINNIIYNYTRYFSYRQKNLGKIYFDILIMYIMLYFPYTLSNFEKNVNNFTIFSSIVTNFLFIFLGRIEFFDFVLSNSYSWKISQIIFLLSITFLYFFPIFYHNKEFYTKYTLHYFITISVLTIISVILFAIDKNIKTFHIHHWIIGYCLFFLFRTQKNILQILCGISIGTFIHGSITYGFDTIFS